MIKALLTVKEVVRSFYGRYDRYVNGLIRFVYALAVYLTILYNAGYNASLSSPFIPVGLALISAFLPLYMTPVLGALYLSVQFLSVSVEIAVVALVFFLVMLLLYFVFRANDGWLMMLTMTLCLWNFPAVLLPAALVANPVETIVVAFGVLIYGLVIAVRKDISVFVTEGATRLTLGARINRLLTDLISDEYFLLLVISLSAAFLLISIIRRSKINHAPLVAVVAGDLLFLISFLLGSYFLDIPIRFLSVAVGFLLNAVISFIMVTLVLSYDYKRTEEVRFEDDDYYYFVKAIPKTAISLKERRVESITKREKPSEETGDIDVKQVFVRRDEMRRNDRAE